MEPGLMTVSLDRIFQSNPDVIFVQTYPPSTAPLSQQLANNPRWKQLKAVQTGQVHEVDQFWHSGNGTRIMQVMLNQLMPIIYPNCFPRLPFQLKEFHHDRSHPDKDFSMGETRTELKKQLLAPVWQATLPTCSIFNRSVSASQS